MKARKNTLSYLSLLNLFLLSSLFSGSFQMNFNFDLEARVMKCFGEYLVENANTKFHFSSIIIEEPNSNTLKKDKSSSNTNTNSSQFRVRLFDPNGNVIFAKENRVDIILNLIASETGIFQICFDNYTKNVVPINFQILSGIAAKDYSTLATVSKITPIELMLVKLMDSIEYLIKEYSLVFSNEIQEKIDNHETISSKIFFYSAIVFVTIVVINLLEFALLKRYVEYRKKI
mmetsp:Transcript_16016/g.16614  ORF Transcript_16016/g.16614 Transcript_16016/m.16614 type:complete len:231 (+) Transcript_16016:10-702(+)